MKYGLLLALGVLFCSACSGARQERQCVYAGGMEMQACKYELAELSRIGGQQGVQLQGRLLEEAGQLHLVDGSHRVMISAVLDQRFADVRGRMLGRHVDVIGIYEGAQQALVVYHIKWISEPEPRPGHGA